MELTQHYADHGSEVEAANEKDYETLADMFWREPKPVQMHECRRKGGDILRFDPLTDTYSVVDSKSVIRTFFRPIPCVSIPMPQQVLVRRSGRCHPYADNLIYFQMECRRW